MNNLLFDFGNVIIDIDVEGAIGRMTRLFKNDVERSVLTRIVNEYECGRISTDIFLNKLISHSQPGVQAYHIVEAWNSMLIGIPAHRLEMLKSLRKKYNVYLLSNTNELHLDWVYKHLRRDHQVEDFEKEFFDQAFYSHLVGDRKPLPSIFRHVIDETLQSPALTLFMDDVKENIDVADQLGFQTHWVQPGEEIGEYLRKEGYF